MIQFAGIFLHVNTGNADALALAVLLDVDIAFLGNIGTNRKFRPRATWRGLHAISNTYALCAPVFGATSLSRTST